MNEIELTESVALVAHDYLDNTTDNSVGELDVPQDNIIIFKQLPKQLFESILSLSHEGRVNKVTKELFERHREAHDKKAKQSPEPKPSYWRASIGRKINESHEGTIHVDVLRYGDRLKEFLPGISQNEQNELKQLAVDKINKQFIEKMQEIARNRAKGTEGSIAGDIARMASDQPETVYSEKNYTFVRGARTRELRDDATMRYAYAEVMKYREERLSKADFLSGFDYQDSIDSTLPREEEKLQMYLAQGVNIFCAGVLSGGLGVIAAAAVNCSLATAYCAIRSIKYLEEAERLKQEREENDIVASEAALSIGLRGEDIQDPKFKDMLAARRIAASDYRLIGATVPEPSYGVVPMDR